MLNTRGKRVIAEATIPNALLQSVVRADSADMYCAQRHHGHLHRDGPGRRQRRRVERRLRLRRAAPERRLLLLDHHPVADVATYGGGTGLATQRECLELLGCYGDGKVRKFAEIVAATVLCGEMSLGSAIVAEEWVDSHDAHGRNRS